MAQHLSIRVPWHDNGWNGTVCLSPSDNNSCLRLKNIYENKNDKKEESICGKCMKGQEMDLPCINEGAAFMSNTELKRVTLHPYAKLNPSTHGHFKETNIIYPAYSFPTVPYKWMMRNYIQLNSKDYDISYDTEKEPILNWDTVWVQDASNHRAIFEYFYKEVKPNESLCIAYAKQVPFIEDTRRVIVGIGNVKNIIPAVEHEHTDEKELRSMTWETMICHSIRENHEEGFIIPYQKMMKYAEEHPEFDMADITVFAPDDAFDEFSYAAEHVSHDAVIEVILSCIKAFEIINKCLDEDYTNVLQWLNIKLSEVWIDRGAFPGLGAMLCALNIELGVLIAKEIKETIDETKQDLWEYLDLIIEEPNKYLSENLAEKITPIVKKTWKGLSEERKTLFKLLSRFSLNIEQAYNIFNTEQRYKLGINCSDKEIIENPYLLYEQTRLRNDTSFISVKKIDRAIFLVPSISEQYPLEEPTKLTSNNDERRIRALAISVLENEALNGHTIMPCDLLVDKVNNMIIEPVCNVTKDMFNAIEIFLDEEILKRNMKDGTQYYKLVRINEFDKVIEKRIRKRLKSEPIEINANWRKIFDEYLVSVGVSGEITEKEEKARLEKSACLEILAKSRISVLVGDAGTGKTTVLAALCTEPSIKVGGVLLLAPTGKATVRLLESMGENSDNFDAMNVAQFLSKSKRFEDMRYKLSECKNEDTHETVIIDEASMLTEEMFGALMEALGSAKRIIFVGDPNQLPPIGAGRPFVDLVHLLKQDLPVKKFPRVCKSYGELTVNRRQQSENERTDVKLAKYFTDSEEERDENIISEILLGNQNNITFEKWETKEELEQKILKVLVENTDMENENDINGFNQSLGGEILEYETLFKTGAAKFVSDWQILAPVRNMPQGVMNINRFIHEKYREHYIEIATRWGKRKRIPKALGPEKIVYGDKVINIENSRRSAYPKEIAKNYVANGEIGIACNCYSKDKPTDYLNIEFSTQKGVTYGYKDKDFNEESGKCSLELAYALTVHKSQGSQFKTVILVLSEPCRIISKEMLYTALTRQTEKIVILYNKELHEILKYSSDEYSDISKRFTDLFADVCNEDGKEYKPQIVKVGNNFYEERLIHHTVEGEIVRSKSEVIIANALHYNGLKYEYEPILKLENRIFRPDFKVIDGDTGKIWYWEHGGLMTDSKYRKDLENKKAFYAKNGIEENKNLIITFDDEKGGIDSKAIDELIKKIFDL